MKQGRLNQQLVEESSMARAPVATREQTYGIINSLEETTYNHLHVQHRVPQASAGVNEKML